MFSKKDIAILIGNSLDHYNTALYGFLVPILSPIFFPTHDPIVSIILGYSILAITFFAAPIGSIIFGSLAKYYGPKVSLSYSLIGLSIATVIIGLIPTYQIIGAASSILLITTRVIQGVFAGGEVAISRLYILEEKSNKNAFRASYYFQLSTMVGIILASIAASIIYLLPLSFIYWRLCFFFGGFAGVIGYILRNNKNDKDTKYLQLIQKKSITNLFDIKSIIKGRKILAVISLTSSFNYLTYYVPFILMNSLVPLVSNISIKTMMELNTVLLILDTALIPIIGTISTRFDIEKILISSSLVFAITIIPLIYYLNNASLFYAIIVRVWIVIIGVVFLCPLNLWYKNLKIQEDEYILVGIANSLGGGLLGKATPAISLSIWYITESLLLIGIYFALIALATLSVIYKYGANKRC